MLCAHASKLFCDCSDNPDQDLFINIDLNLISHAAEDDDDDIEGLENGPSSAKKSRRKSKAAVKPKKTATHK